MLMIFLLNWTELMLSFLKWENMLVYMIQKTPPPLFKGGEYILITSPWGEDSKKFLKGGRSMVQEQVFLKKGGAGTFPI